MSGARLQPHHEPDTTWREQAACKNIPEPEVFYKDGTSDHKPNKPKVSRPDPRASATCGLCPVAGDCLRAGLHEPFGIWAGTTPYERHWLRSVLKGRGETEQRRPNKQRRTVVLGVAIRAGLLGES